MMSGAFYRIEMLPARHGDALWIEYGKRKTTRRILIDGGPIIAYNNLYSRLKTLPDGDKRVELLVISHVDTDHIEGVIRLLAERRGNWAIEPNDIWFNGWRHIGEAKDLGGREGDFLSALIRRRAFAEWNKAFNHQAVVIQKDKRLPEVTLSDGMRLTLLSPTSDKLKSMEKAWKKDVEKHGIEPGDLDAAWGQLVETTKYHPEEGLLGGPANFTDKLKKQLKTDQSLANGTSISFLATFEGKSCLFLADAHADVICRSLRELIPIGQGRLKVDAVKMSHHGSMHNISEDLVKLIDAKHFLISTDGSIHNHPDKPAIEAVIQAAVQKPTLWFNYRSKHNALWEKGPTERRQKFSAEYPKNSREGITVAL